MPSLAPDMIQMAQTTPVLRMARRVLAIVTPGTEAESIVAEFIAERFRVAYGARPSLRIPQLMALMTEEGRLLAAVGIREAGEQALFLEDYLDRPIEACLPDSGPRHRVAEIAHLAGVENGVSRVLFPALTLWLYDQGFRWAVFTGTEQLRNSFGRLGIDIHHLGEARPECLADGGRGWGAYYSHRPCVLAGNVDRSYHGLQASGLLRAVEFIQREEHYERSA